MSKILDAAKALFSSKPGGGAAPEGDPELQDQATQWITEHWQDLKSVYVTYHQQIWQAFLFYVGESWIQWEKNRNIFTPQVPSDEFTPQPRINRFSPAIDSVASNFANVPEVEAVAVPEDDEQVIGVAEIVNGLIDHAVKTYALKQDYKSQEDKAGLAAQTFVLAGSVFTDVYAHDEVIGQRNVMDGQNVFSAQCPQCDTFQTDLPEPPQSCPQCQGPLNVNQSESMQPVMDEEGNPLQEPVTRKTICVETDSPLFFFPRPGSTSMADNPYMIRAERMYLGRIKELWGVDATADSEYPDATSVTYKHALDYWYMGYSSGSLAIKDSCLVLRAYLEPGKVDEFPDGLFAVYINGKCAYANTWDQEFCEHPLTMFGYMQIPTLFFARSIAFDMVEIQRERNAYESLIKLHALTSAVDPIVIDENTIVSEITGRADQKVIWRSFGPGAKEPHRMAHGNLDPAIYEKIEKLDQEMMHIAAVASIMRGESPGEGVTANAAITQLRSQAELQFAKPTQNWNAGWKETIRKIVKNMQRYWTVQQIAEVIGPDKMQQIQDFLNADLDKCITFIATSTGLPRSRDERRQEMMALFDKQALDINDPNVRQKLFELFGDTGMMKTFNDDARRARLNIRKMKDGSPAEFRPGIDDPDVHLGLTMETAKSLDFDQWPQPSQQLLLQYIQQVQQVAQQNAPPAPPNPLQVQQLKNQGDEKRERIKADTSVVVADIGAKSKMDAAAIADLLTKMDQVYQLLQGGSSPNSQTSGNGSTPAPSPAQEAVSQ